MTGSQQEIIATARQNGDYSALVTSIPYARFLGIAVETHKLQRRYRLPSRPGLVGNTSLPALHGGALAAFAESAALIEVLLIQPEQTRIPKSVDFSVDYVRSAGPVDTWADCHVVRQGRNVVLVQITVWQKQPSTPVVTARVHFLLDEPLESK